MGSFSGYEESPAYEDESPCRNCAWYEYCQTKRAACGRFFQYVESGENRRYPKSTSSMAMREAQGKAQLPMYDFYWAYPTRGIYYKVFEETFKDDVLALSRDMTLTEAAYELKVSRKYLARKLKAWKEACDQERA